MVNRYALRVIRQRSGLSISVLASQAGISQPHLSNIESGRRQASPAVVRRLAAALKVPVVALVVAPDEPDEPDAPTADDGDHPRWVDLVRRRSIAAYARRCRRISGPCRGTAPRRRPLG
jgi:transcriptional regulator with XRE-family HTH domain